MTTFDARGIRDDNLLGFLALLGALHALEVAKPEWNARVRWVGPPYHPQLHVSTAIDEDLLLEAMSAGALQIAGSTQFDGHSDVKFLGAEARALASRAMSDDGAPREQWYSALFSDGALKDGKDVAQAVVVAPPLVTMLGQGHQHFLTRVVDVGQGTLPKDLARARKPIDLNAPAILRRALFEEWKREDATDAFRWDPQEDRRYALRDRNPSSDAGTTEHGANRLALCALPLLTSFPTGRRGAQAITTLGFSTGSDRKRRISWPIWTALLDLPTIIALMTESAVHKDSPQVERLGAYGVLAVMRALRVENGYYANFGWAERCV